jgi:hypothetical protein
VALVKDFLLVFDVVVERALGNLQRLGHVVKRSVVVAPLTEGPAGLLDDGFALYSMDLVVDPEVAVPPRQGRTPEIATGNVAELNP